MVLTFAFVELEPPDEEGVDFGVDAGSDCSVEAEDMAGQARLAAVASAAGIAGLKGTSAAGPAYKPVSPASHSTAVAAPEASEARSIAEQAEAVAVRTVDCIAAARSDQAALVTEERQP